MTTTLRATRAARHRALALAAGATAALSITLSACGGGKGGGGGTGPDTTTVVGPTQYVNPVINADFPDPAVMKAADGSYYAYATQTTGVKIQGARSTDLVTWNTLGEMLPVKPSWASQSGNFWAPDVELRDGKYVMYFSAQIDADKRTGNDGFCIGMATSTAPAGPFVDVGAPVRCGPGFTTIDPMGFDDPQTGKHYLYWGSSGSPIMVQELAANRASFAAGSTPAAVVQVRGGNDGYDTGLIEGPWVTYNAPYYYLYFSGNNCCGAGAHYAVMVARASSPTGPFTVQTGGGSAALPILVASSKWLGPGHNSTIRDGAGAEWIVYHAIDAFNPYLIAGRTDISRRPMLLDRITYVDGWPTVSPNGMPTSTPQTKPTP